MIIIGKIKVRNIVKGTIKTFDRGAITLQKSKNNLVKIKQKTDNYQNIDEYSTRQLKTFSKDAKNDFIVGNKKGINSVKKTKKNLIKTKNQIKKFKNKLRKKKRIKQSKKNIKSGRIILQKNNNYIKIGKQFTINNIQKRKSANSIINFSKKTFKITFSSIKALVFGTKALITLLIAGGWILITIIIVICLVGLICSSIFGIFFSNEKVDSKIQMSDIVSELNTELDKKIYDIKKDKEHDDFKIISNKIDWKVFLSIYTVKTSNNNTEEVLTLTEKKKKKLKDMYWEIITIDSEIKQEGEDNEDILYITINSKTKKEIMDKYKFSTEQRLQVEDLLSKDYDNLWASIIYGTSHSNIDLVNIALKQVGNVGGEPYWSWYGFNSRVEWCAIFVSWVANEAGYIDAGVIPKFSVCLDGVNWFKDKGQWKEPSYIPKSGDIIFFDWEDDDEVNHVGIVEKVENNIIYTIEGNSTNDTCRKQQYNINSDLIFGFGTPTYL